MDHVDEKAALITRPSIRVAIPKEVEERLRFGVREAARIKRHIPSPPHPEWGVRDRYPLNQIMPP